MFYMSGGVKLKKDGSHRSFNHVRKYHDAIMYRAEIASQILPVGYLNHMEGFL